MRLPLLRLLLAALAAAALNATAAGAELSPWVVPVLRLVSATHVEPTTGVVLSSAGLVLVPHDFARIGDEIVDRRTPFGVRARRDIAARFVEHEAAEGGATGGLSVSS